MRRYNKDLTHEERLELCRLRQKEIDATLDKTPLEARGTQYILGQSVDGYHPGAPLKLGYLSLAFCSNACKFCDDELSNHYYPEGCKKRKEPFSPEEWIECKKQWRKNLMQSEKRILSHIEYFKQTGQI